MTVGFFIFRAQQLGFVNGVGRGNCSLWKAQKLSQWMTECPFCLETQIWKQEEKPAKRIALRAYFLETRRKAKKLAPTHPPFFIKNLVYFNISK